MISLVMARRPPLRDVGKDPDVRFTFANERTFLAWNQAALALVAAGLAVTQLVPPEHLPVDSRLLGIPPILLAAVVSFISYRRWEDNERAMRLGEPLPPSRLPMVFAAFTAAGAVVAGLLSLFSPR